MLVVYGFGLAIVGSGGARAFRQQLWLKLEKSRLAGALERAHDELARTNDVLDQRVERVTERLAQANQLASLARLAAGVAHEINNPLSWVVTNATFLRESLESAVMEPTKKATLIGATDDMITGGERISAIVNDMVSLARDREESVELDLHKLIDRCVSVTRSAIDNTARVELDFAADSPIVIGSRAGLSQLFINLLMNAAESFCGNDAKALIRIGTSSSGGTVTVEVCDSGRGISAQALDRVFEPFYTTKRAGEGSGLGLAICRNIVESHAGSIAASSSETGATLTVCLPIADRKEPQSDTQNKRLADIA